MPGYADEPARVLKTRFTTATSVTRQAALADELSRRATDQLALIHARRPGDPVPVVKSLDELDTEDLDTLDPESDGLIYRRIWRSREGSADEKARAGATLAALAFRYMHGAGRR